MRPNLRLARVDGEGELVLADLDSTTAVLNFWATWCTACVAELAGASKRSHNALRRAYDLSESPSTRGDRREAVQAFLAERGVSYEQVWGEVADEQPFASLASTPPGAIPITAVLHHGTVRDVRVGAVDVGELAQLLERLLAGG